MLLYWSLWQFVLHVSGPLDQMYFHDFPGDHLKKAACVKNLEEGDPPNGLMQQFLAMHEHALETLIYY